MFGSNGRLFVFFICNGKNDHDDQSYYTYNQSDELKQIRVSNVTHHITSFRRETHRLSVMGILDNITTL